MLCDTGERVTALGKVVWDDGFSEKGSLSLGLEDESGKEVRSFQVGENLCVKMRAYQIEFYSLDGSFCSFSCGLESLKKASITRI